MLLKLGELGVLDQSGISVRSFRINEIKREGAAATYGVFVVKRGIVMVTKSRFYGIAFAGRG